MAFPYSLVLFDLDGTLVDTAPDIAEAVNRTLADWRLPRTTPARIREWIGDGARQLIETAFRDAGSDMPIEEIMPGFMVHYGECLLLQARLYPGVAEALNALRAQGVTLALCTNKPDRFLMPLLSHLGIADAFSAMVGADTLPARKPDPLPLLHLAAQFGCAVEDCLMVGDSGTDLLAARAARMSAVLCRYGYLRGFDVRPGDVVATIDDMRALLDLDARSGLPAAS